MSRMKLEDFSPALQAQIKAKLAEYDRLIVKPPVTPVPQLTPVAGKEPNSTELECRNLFTGEFTFEGRTFDICGGARYTPDWVDNLCRVAIEAKGEFIHSRDSRRRFDEAVHLYPDWRWIWARKRTKGRKGPRWEIEVFQPSARKNGQEVSHA